MEQCQKFAKDHRIGIIFSCIDFEIWVLLHFEPVTKRYSAEQLNNKLSGADYFGTNYPRFKGNDYDDYLIDRIKQALLNAKRLEKNYCEPWYLNNPYTNVNAAIPAIFGVDESKP